MTDPIETRLGGWQALNRLRLDEVASAALEDGHLQAYRYDDDGENIKHEEGLLGRYTYTPPCGGVVQARRFYVRTRETLNDETGVYVVVYFTATYFIAEVLAED